MMNPHAVSLTLEVGNLVEQTYRAPGQFVHIRCGEASLLRRPISVCTCQADTPEDLLRIVFEVRGEGTRWLSQRQEGDDLDVLGLLGNGFSVKGEERYLLVGGGIGVPPLYGCAQSGAQNSATAILGFRGADRVMLVEEMKECCGKVLVCTDDGSFGEHGFVDSLLHRELETDSHYDGILACGPKGMLRSVARVAAEVQIPCQVSMEERMGCGVGACLVCACDMNSGARKHVCKDGPVFLAQEVDWDA